MRMRSRPEISCSNTVNKRRGQAHQPRQDQQQSDPHEHREKEADPPREFAPRGRQPVDEDRDEDDVVDPEHQFERRQRDERDPGFRTDEKVEHRSGYVRKARQRPTKTQIQDRGETPAI